MKSEYANDAIYHLRRTAELLSSSSLADEQTDDAAIHFAFAIEKFCKAVLYDVNPILTLENNNFENAAAVLYRGRMVGKHKEKAENQASKDDLKCNSCAMSTALIGAQGFSNAVDAHIGLFTKLAEYRNTLAHRTRSELNYDETKRKLLGAFHPTTVLFAGELGIKADDVFQGNEATLREASERIKIEERFAERMKTRLEKHRLMWEKRKSDLGFVEYADSETKETGRTNQFAGTLAATTKCPACGNQAILFLDYDLDHDGQISMIRVEALECRFCEFEIEDLEEIDFFKLNDAIPFDE